MMGILRIKFQNQLIGNNKLSELQAAYAEGRRATDNLFILKYCVFKSFYMKQMLVVIAIDFKKAFDSIRRETIIQVMMKYKIHPNLIDFIAKIYTNDKTCMYINSEYVCDINITNGIKQGCNGSTVLFLMITYIILEKLQASGSNFRCNICTIAAIFFADDGLLMAQSMEEARESITLLIEVARECGLELNKEKSNILIFNSNENIQSIEGIEVASEINYLGLNITNKKDCFKLQKEKIIKEAGKYSNIVPSIVQRSCNRAMIGTTYWKNVVLSKILYGLEVLDFNKSELAHMQREENKAFRFILKAPIYTPIVTLRGEIGASTFTSRDMKTKFNFIRHLLEEDNSLLKNILMDLLEIKKDKWAKTVYSYLECVNLTIPKLKTMKKEEIDKIVDAFDSQEWEKEIRGKSTLSIYKNFKQKIKNENVLYDNTFGSVLLFRARTNTLNLKWRQKFVKENTSCPMCGYSDENLEHFILDCTYLQNERNYSKILRRPYQEDVLKHFLLFDKPEIYDIENTKITLKKLWMKRENKLHVLAQQ